MRKILFIADFWKHQLSGGAENNDNNLLVYLSEYYEIATCNTHSLTQRIVDEFELVIVSNFVHLSSEMMQYLQDSKPYIIYEHDHKYLKNRDPSQYLNYQVPEEQKINQDFYLNADKVFVLSKICKQILEKNIPGSKVHNIGCSIWSEDTFDFIESLLTVEKKNDLCILKSENPVKNYLKALSYCKEKNITPYELSNPDYRSFLRSMSSCKRFLFIPGVLETFSRVCAEAKMLNLKVLTTPKKLGFASEDIYTLSGLDLIRELRHRSKTALLTFRKEIENSLAEKDNSITVILTCYRRPEYLEEQIAAIKSQTIKPKQIWIWVNQHRENDHVDFSKFDVDRVIKNDFNWKFHGRFAIAQAAQTNFVALFDDDTIPGKQWFENCLTHYTKKPGIYGGIGVILQEDKYHGHKRVGWSSPNKSLTEVDLVGHAWFINKKDLQYMWREEPFTWHNGEDIQLSYLAKKYGNVNTYVPPHPLRQTEMFSSLKGVQYGVDDKATSRPSNHKVFYNERDEQVRYSIKNGWKPIFLRSKI